MRGVMRASGVHSESVQLRVTIEVLQLRISKEERGFRVRDTA